MRRGRHEVARGDPIRRCFIGALVLGSASAATAGCLPPEAPIGTDPALVAEYRPEILANYERYFSESSAFIACLDEARGQAMADLAARVADYQMLFDSPAEPKTSLQEEDH